MAYFFILPVFFLAVFAQLLALLATVLVTELRSTRVYLWRILTWSSAGFFVANILVMMLAAIPFLVLWAGQSSEDAELTGAQKALALSGAAILFLGPIIASPLGFGAGACWGIVRAGRAKRSSAQSQPPLDTVAPVA